MMREENSVTRQAKNACSEKLFKWKIPLFINKLLPCVSVNYDIFFAQEFKKSVKFMRAWRKHINLFTIFCSFDSFSISFSAVYKALSRIIEFLLIEPRKNLLFFK